MDINEDYRSGYVAIVGLPNAGKSTLLNALVDCDLSIVSQMPQTTRNQILGIRTTEHSQIMFLDTPGWYEGSVTVDSFYRKQVSAAIEDADVLVYVLDGRSPKPDLNLACFSLLVENKKKPVILVVSKMDTLKQAKLIPLLDWVAKSFSRADEIIPLCALKGQNLEPLIEQLEKRLSVGPRWFPQEAITDRTPDFMLGEFIREAFLGFAREEVPFAIAVVVDQFRELQGKFSASCKVYVERDGQKGILIGAQGENIRLVKAEVAKKVRRLYSKKLDLKLWIKVKPDWRKSPQILSSLGYKA